MKIAYVAVAVVAVLSLALTGYLLLGSSARLALPGTAPKVPLSTVTPSPQSFSTLPGLSTESANQLVGQGVRRLLEFYEKYPQVVTSSAFQVVLKGKLESLTETSLVLTDPTGGQTITLNLENTSSQPVAYLERGIGATGTLRRIGKAELVARSLVEVQLSIAPTTGKMALETVTKIAAN